MSVLSRCSRVREVLVDGGCLEEKRERGSEEGWTVLMLGVLPKPLLLLASFLSIPAVLQEPPVLNATTVPPTTFTQQLTWVHNEIYRSWAERAAFTCHICISIR